MVMLKAVLLEREGKGCLAREGADSEEQGGKVRHTSGYKCWIWLVWFPGYCLGC